MRRIHFETLRPVCPVCRPAGGEGHPLRIGQVAREELDHIVEGALLCTNHECQREFPIIDGVPLLVTSIRQYVSDNVLAISQRRDLSDLVESMLGDCCGPGSAFDSARQHISSYTWDHYGDLDPAESRDEPAPSSMLRCLEVGRKLAGDPSAGPILDLGCSVGRGSFALAQSTQQMVLGVDLHFPMLRLAAEVLRTGTVRYPRRRVGLVYDRREFAARFPHHDQVDFWACDATALPFAEGTFSLAVGMNVLDCIADPRAFLASAARVLRLGAKLLLACPYDWSAAATPVEAWLGGHSQRSPPEGSSSAAVRALLSGEQPGSMRDLRLVAERDDLRWWVRLHERSTMLYRTHLLVAEKVPSV